MKPHDSILKAEKPAHHRTIWISDIHLGTSGCKAEYLLDFLKWNESDTLYLVGDIIDGWQLKKGWYWKQSHNDVVQKILRRARKGARVVYIAGNHDEVVRQFIGMAFGEIEIADCLQCVGQRTVLLVDRQRSSQAAYCACSSVSSATASSQRRARLRRSAGRRVRITGAPAACAAR